MNTSDQISENAVNQSMARTINVGQTLRDAREQMGLSVIDIAGRIKFSPRQVEALEANDFAQLPEPAFVRGFIRSYARTLELDAAELIAALPQEVAKQPASMPTPKGESIPITEGDKGVNLAWLGGALVLAILLGMFVLMGDRKPSEVAVSKTIEPVTLPSAEVPSASEVAAVPSEASAVEQPKVADKPKAVAGPEAAPETKKEPPKKRKVEPEKFVELGQKMHVGMAPAVAPEAATADEGSETAAGEKPAVPETALKRRPMHFVFLADAWAEVKDVNGVVLLSRVVRGGEERWVGGPRRAPYDVSISSPDKVKLYYLGNEIDLSSYAGQEVIHIKVE